MKAQGQIFTNEMVIMPDVNVFELGTKNSTRTNSDGKFTINVANAKSQLRFSFVGYDYDTVDADYFIKNSYLELYPSKTALADVTISPKKKGDNTFFWILAIIGAGFVIKKMSKKPIKVKK